MTTSTLDFSSVSSSDCCSYGSHPTRVPRCTQSSGRIVSACRTKAWRTSGTSRFRPPCGATTAHVSGGLDVTTDWVYPSSLEELNAALQEERIEALETRRRGDKKYYPATHCYRTPAKWDAHRYRYKLKEPKAMNNKPHAAYISLQIESGIEVGDTVRIEPINVPPEMLGFPGWSDTHQACVGDTCEVFAINDFGIGLKTEQGRRMYFPFFALRVMEKAPEILKVAGYDVAVHSGGAIRFGCTTINKRDVELIFGVWNGSNLPK